MSYCIGNSITSESKLKQIKGDLQNAQLVLSKNGYNKETLKTVEGILGHCSDLIKGEKSEFSKKIKKWIEDLEKTGKADLQNDFSKTSDSTYIQKIKQVTKSIEDQDKKMEQTENLNKKLVESIIRKMGESISARMSAKTEAKERNPFHIAEGEDEKLDLGKGRITHIMSKYFPEDPKSIMIYIGGDGETFEGNFSGGRVSTAGKEKERAFVGVAIGTSEQRGKILNDETAREQLRSKFLEIGTELSQSNPDAPRILAGHSSGSPHVLSLCIGKEEDVEEISNLQDAYDYMMSISMGTSYFYALESELRNSKGDKKIYLRTDKFLLVEGPEDGGPSVGRMEALLEHVVVLTEDGISEINPGVYLIDGRRGYTTEQIEEAFKEHPYDFKLLQISANHASTPVVSIDGQGDNQPGVSEYFTKNVTSHLIVELNKNDTEKKQEIKLNNSEVQEEFKESETKVQELEQTEKSEEKKIEDIKIEAKEETIVQQQEQAHIKEPEEAKHEETIINEEQKTETKLQEPEQIKKPETTKPNTNQNQTAQTKIIPTVKNSNSEENKKLAKNYGYDMVGNIGNSAKIGYKKGTGNTKTLDIIIPDLDNLTDFISKNDMHNYKGKNDILVVQFNDDNSWKNSEDIFKDIYDSIISYINKGYKININGAKDSEEIIKKLEEYIKKK